MFGVEESEEQESATAAEVSASAQESAGLTQQVEEGAQALERALEEIEDIPIPAPQVDAVRSAPVQKEPVFSLAGTGEKSPVEEALPVPDDVKELTEKFMEEKEQKDRKEATPAQVTQYQAAEPVKAYCFPPVTMLAVSPHGNPAMETEELQTNGRILVDTLKSFGVQTKILDICGGLLLPGMKSSKPPG